MGKSNTKQILEVINNHQYEQLSDYLSDVNWLEIDPLTIVPQQAIRSFAKAIVDKEVRLDVMRFLETYAENYFRTGAETLVRHDYAQKHVGFTSAVIRIEADQYIDKFKTELKTQIKQLQSSGEFTGEKYKKQEELIDSLYERIGHLEEENTKLSTQLEKYKHPHANGKYIPDELKNDDFYNIMSHLSDQKIVRVVSEPDEIGVRKIICYQWDASKALFGYFVERINNEFDLRGARVPLNWKIFRPVINNFDEIIDEARKALSTYNNSSILHKNRIEKAEMVDKAIECKEFPFLIREYVVR